MFDIDEDDEHANEKKILIYLLLVFALGVGVYFIFKVLLWLAEFMGKAVTGT